MPARDASTGEQKALLIGLVLAHAALVADMTGTAPVLLLDEVVAHLDPARRAALFDELGRSARQVWMTGADPAAFTESARGRHYRRPTSPRVARPRAGSRRHGTQFGPNRAFAAPRLISGLWRSPGRQYGQQFLKIHAANL